MNELKQNIETLAKEGNRSELSVISDLQSAAASTGNDELLNMLCELKWDYIA